MVRFKRNSLLCEYPIIINGDVSSTIKLLESYYRFDLKVRFSLWKYYKLLNSSQNCVRDRSFLFKKRVNIMHISIYFDLHHNDIL